MKRLSSNDLGLAIVFGLAFMTVMQLAFTFGPLLLDDPIRPPSAWTLGWLLVVGLLATAGFAYMIAQLPRWQRLAPWLPVLGILSGVVASVFSRGATVNSTIELTTFTFLLGVFLFALKVVRVRQSVSETAPRR